nr:MAG TPA: hypothetical protein [Caudoviricetes sp.]
MKLVSIRDRRNCWQSGYTASSISDTIIITGVAYEINKISRK